MINKSSLLVFTFPDVMGGVSSFNYNLIKYSSLKEKCNIKVIKIREIEDIRSPFYDIIEDVETIQFNYSRFENQYYVCKRLSYLIGKEPGALICDNQISLLSTILFPTQKTIYHLIHDFFYVKQNCIYQNIIDIAIAHSTLFSDCIFASYPEKFNKSALYIPYGVRQLKLFPEKKQNQKLKLMFLGRLEKDKGVDQLSLIDDKLKLSNVDVDWLIIGRGSMQNFLIDQWKNKQNIIFMSPDTNNEVYEIIKNQDIFVFPTKFEGTPVSILEAISNGIVTIVSDLPGGIRDVITDELGYKIKIGDIDGYVSAITKLNNDRTMLYKMQLASWKKAKANYDVSINADYYFREFISFEKYKTEKTSKVIPNLSRLDKSYFPNFIVKLIRKIK